MFFAIPGVAAGLAEERRLLVAGDPGDRDLAAELRGRAEDAADGSGSGSRSGSTPSSSQSSGSQRRSPMSNSIVREALERSVAWRPVSLNTSQESIVPKTASRGRLDVAQQPLDLRPGEVGIEDEAGALADERLVPGLAQLVAARRRAPVLPDERVVDRLAGARVPGDDGLALVGDPDRVEARRIGLRVGERMRGDPLVTSQISFASCSTQPGRGKCWRNSL